MKMCSMANGMIDPSFLDNHGTLSYHDVAFRIATNSFRQPGSLHIDSDFGEKVGEGLDLFNLAIPKFHRAGESLA